ncbi:MAG: hypothetical protein HQL27_09085 [Candidatus Omnitrophica bacterium]|nr:hypothetical protein [Candidatus Omnitrophota bacterium]
MKKINKILLIGFLVISVFFTGIFFCRDIIYKYFLVKAIESMLNADCTIEGLDLTRKGIYITNMRIFHEVFDGIIKKGLIGCNIFTLRKHGMGSFMVDGAYIKVKKAKRIQLISRDAPLFLDLKNIHVVFNPTISIGMGFNVSYKGVLHHKKISKSDYFDISNFNINIGKHRINNLNLTRVKGQNYLLKTDEIVLNEKSLKNLRFPMELDKNFFILNGVNIAPLGPNSLARGRIEFNGFNDVCLKTDFEKLSLNEIMGIFFDKKDVMMKGQYQGFFNICGSGRKVYKLEGKFVNDNGGSIEIKNESAFRFLSRYLNESIYVALVDSLKEYTYDKGSIEINKKDDDLVSSFNLSSEKQGQRNFDINFHDIAGEIK